MFGGGFAGLFEIIIRLRTIAFICDRPSSVERWWARRTAKAYCIAAKREVTKKTEKSMYMQFHMCSLYRGLCPPPTFSLPNILLLGLAQASFQGLARPSRPLLRLPRKRGWLHRSKRRFVREKRSFEVNLLQIFESANIAPAFASNSYLVTSTLAYNTPI